MSVYEGWVSDGYVALRRSSHTDKLGHKQQTNTTKQTKTSLLTNHFFLAFASLHWRLKTIGLEETNSVPVINVLFAWRVPIAEMNEVKIAAWC